MVYIVAAVAGLELVDVLVPSSTLPEWSDELLLSLVILGFPLALVLAWAFEITPGGVKRTPAAEGSAGGGSTPARPATTDEGLSDRSATGVTPGGDVRVVA